MTWAGDHWCILTTAGPRTLPLARALAEQGIRAWTPVRTERRTGRGKKRKDVVMIDVAMTPTFVFVGAGHMHDLLRVRDLPASPYPPFNALRFLGRIPTISDASLNPLRAAEERFRKSMLKSIRRRVEPGTTVRPTKGGFAGMIGVVEGSTHKEARVNFGGGFVVTIASYLLDADVLCSTPSPALGVAA